MKKKKDKWTTAYHKGGLKECLETEQQISEEYALTLIMEGLYKFYAFDSRIKAHRYIIADMKNNLGLPQWIHHYKYEK